MPLTDIKIRQAKPADKPIKLADTAGLYLEVKPSGSKLWRYRYRIAGRENLFAIGEYPQVSLADARKARDDARELIRQGRHPAHARQTERTRQINANALTFKAIAEEWIEKKRSRWAPYYLMQVERGMKKDIYPRIGRLPIRSVTAADVLAILDRATKRGAEVVALNLRQWCSQVFRYAVATLRADHDPASALRGAVIRPPVNHSRPMDRDEIAAFLRKLQGFGGHRTTVIALRLLLLTFVRTIEMRKAEWTEVDLAAAEWRIPAEKMKMRRLHIVPLSTQAVALLTELKSITGAGRWLFPNHRRPHDVMSATTVNHALMSLGFASATITAHDFRATASTRLHEMGLRSDFIELQLAHVERRQAAFTSLVASRAPPRTGGCCPVRTTYSPISASCRRPCAVTPSLRLVKPNLRSTYAKCCMFCFSDRSGLPRWASGSGPATRCACAMACWRCGVSSGR